MNEALHTRPLHLAQPFGSSSDIFLPASRRAPLAAALRGLSAGHLLIVLTGDAGTGKTALLTGAILGGDLAGRHRLARHAGSAAGITRACLVAQLLPEDAAADPAPADMVRHLVAHAGKGVRAIVAVDDAHLLADDALDYLGAVLAAARASRARLHVILAGCCELHDRLVCRGLLPDADGWGTLTAFTPGEARAYLMFRAGHAGPAGAAILSDEAAERLCQGTGIPAELERRLSEAAALVTARGAAAITPAIAASVAGEAPEAFAQERLAIRPVLERNPPPWAVLVSFFTLMSGFLLLLQAPLVPTFPRAQFLHPVPVDLLAEVVGSVPPPAAATPGPDAADTAPAGGSEPATPDAGASRQAEAVPLQQYPEPADAGVAVAGLPDDAAAPGVPFAAPVIGPGLSEGTPAGTPALAKRDADIDAPPSTEAMLGPMGSVPAVARVLGATELNAMLQRAGDLLARGELVAARVLYVQAAEARSAAAATIVGKTYDPAFLTKIRITRGRAEPEVAASWYSRAIELGDEEARLRLRQLHARGRP